jgi:hypothetical protein
MHENNFSQNKEYTHRATGINQLRWLVFLIVSCFFPAGCATDSTQVADNSSPAPVPKHTREHTTTLPPRFGAPPYPDDPEGNGNPAKAWYN